MRHANKLTLIIGASALTVAMAGTVAVAASSTGKIKACAAKSNGALRIAKHCKSTEKAVSWNVKGIQGVPGTAGAPGAKGDTGQTGTKGDQGIPGPIGVTKVDYAYHVCSNNADGTQTSCNVQCPVADEVAVGGGIVGQGAFADHQEVNGSRPSKSDGTPALVTADKPTGWMGFVDNLAGGSSTNVTVYVVCIAAPTTTVTSS